MQNNNNEQHETRLMLSIKAIILISPLVIILIWWFSPCYILFLGPFTREEIDFDHNGSISHNEASYYADYQVRNVTVNGQNCIEYYGPKDGIEIKTVCKE